MGQHNTKDNGKDTDTSNEYGMSHILSLLSHHFFYIPHLSSPYYPLSGLLLSHFWMASVELLSIIVKNINSSNNNPVLSQLKTIYKMNDYCDITQQPMTRGVDSSRLAHIG